MREKVIEVVLSAVVVAGLGWMGNALTLVGRVAAIEKGQARIELQLQQLIARDTRP